MVFLIPFVIHSISLQLSRTLLSQKKAPWLPLVRFTSRYPTTLYPAVSHYTLVDKKHGYRFFDSFYIYSCIFWELQKFIIFQLLVTLKFYVCTFMYFAL